MKPMYHMKYISRFDLYSNSTYSGWMSIDDGLSVIEIYLPSIERRMMISTQHIQARVRVYCSQSIM